MRKRTLLIILFILVSAGCALLNSKQIGAQSEVPVVVTEFCFEECNICIEYNPKTGLVEAIYFDGVKRTEKGFKSDINLICAEGMGCREFVRSSEIIGCNNPSYGCGGWGCSFWP